MSRLNTNVRLRNAVVQSSQKQQRPLVAIDDDINLADYLRTLIRYKKPIFNIVVGTTLLGLAATFIIPKTYQANAKIMPRGQSGMGAMGSMVAGTVSRLGLEGLVSDHSGPTNKTMALLESRTLAERV